MPNPKKFTINIDGSTYGLVIQDFHNALKHGFLHYYSRNANIVFKFVTGNERSQIYVRTKEIYAGNGIHNRGLQVGNTLYLHNGWISKGHSINRPLEEFWYPAIANASAAATIVAHEFWHYLFGKKHSNNINCLANTNATAIDLCEVEKVKLRRKYGRPITKT